MIPRDRFLRWLSAGIISVVVSAEPARAQVWEYGGFIDLGYLHDFNDPDVKLFRSRGTAWHLDEIVLNMAGVYVKKRPSDRSRWGSEVLIHAGKDDEIFGFSATAPNLAGSRVLRHLGLANVSYLAPVGLSLQGGIFGSLIGYDSLYAKDNANYTRPWGADFTPYLMLGVNASYPFTDKLTATFAFVNGYWHLAHANNVPSSVVQVAYKPTAASTLKQTIMIGPHQPDTAIGFWRVLSDTIVERRWLRGAAAFEMIVSTERVDAPDRSRVWWMSAQVPVRWSIAGPWNVAARPEIAWDSRGRWTLAEQTVTALTSTLEYRRPLKSATSIVRIEHRFDQSRGPGGGFFDRGEAAPALPRLTPSQHLLIVSAIFTFDSSSQ